MSDTPAKHASLVRRSLVGGVALLSAGLGLSLPLSSQAAGPAALPSTDSLPASLAKALAVHQPLVVMASLPHCPFCNVVRQSYLQPLQATGLPVVQIDMRDSRALVDFDGTPMTQDAWVRLRKVKVAPTVMFFGAQGKEIAARLNGAYLPDFYNSYLEEQLAVARAVVQRANNS
jgi:hypothetical protein